MDEHQERSKSRLHALFVSVLGGDPPPLDAVRSSTTLAHTLGSGERIKALGIQIKAGNLEEREHAWVQLGKILTDNDSRLSSDAEYDVTVILMQCRRDNHIADKAFREFAYGLARNEEFHIRCDAMIILEELARRRDPQAVALLREATRDSEEDVKHNAQTALESLAKDGLV